MHLNPWFIAFAVLYLASYAAYVITRTVVHGWFKDSMENTAAIVVGLLAWPLLLLYMISSAVRKEFAENPIRTIVLTPDEQGYWLISRTYKVIPFGNATQCDLKDGVRGHEPNAGQRTLSFTRHGHVFGPAGFTSYGDLAATTLVAPIVAAILSKSGQGYWLVGADGTVHAFGDAGFFGDISLAPRNYGITWRTDMKVLAAEGAKESKPFLYQDQTTATTAAPTVPVAKQTTASAS